MNSNTDNSSKKLKTIGNVILHLHSAHICANALKFTRTFGLGGMAALLIVIQFVTGILLRFYYDPFLEKPTIK
ncbi:hypothetical protein ACFLS9_02830 [Bacteroidota bacterium]